MEHVPYSLVCFPIPGSFSVWALPSSSLTAQQHLSSPQIILFPLTSCRSTFPPPPPPKDETMDCSTNTPDSLSQVTILNLNEALSRKCDLGMDRSAHTASTSGSTVNFSKTIEMFRPTLRLVDYSESERCAAWYDAAEFRSMKSERRKLVKQMDAGEEPCADCTRGLESKTREGIRKRQMAILNAVAAVLDEQEDQLVRCSADPDALAHIYCMYTRRSQEQALDRAKADRSEADSSEVTAC